MEVKDSQAQGRCREAGSKSRARQRRGSMNKNRMRGVSVAPSVRTLAKPVSIKDAKRKSGDRASKAIELTSGDLPAAPARPGLSGPQGPLTGGQKSAEGIVVRAT